MIEDLEKLKLAIDVEVKHRYIDIHGKTKCFSKFIVSEANKYYKLFKKNPKWAVIAETFAHYPIASVPERRRSIEHLVKVIRSEIAQSKPENMSENSSLTPLKSPSETDVTYVKGVGPKVAYSLNKLGIYTAQDLIFYLPRKHIDYSSRTLIRNLQEGQSTTIFGYVKSVSAFNSKNNLSVVKVKISDESGTIELGFFQAKGNRYTLERTKAQFPVNAGIMVSGTVKMNNYDHRLTFDKPSYSIMTGEFLENGASNLNMARIVPIYTVCENLSVKTLRKAIYNAIQLYKDSIKDILPEYLREKYDLLDKKTAIEQIHFPENQELLEKARFSLIFEELFIVQLKMVRLRNENNKHSAVSLEIKRDGLVQKFIDSLPFELTGGQKRAVNEILNDLHSEKPMARLLQGDVGSGKTVVACIMLLAGIENGYQGAIMAPTEILAQQHYNNLVNWLTPLGLSVGLFLGSQGKKVREKFQTDLRNGQTNIAVGTHALIQDSTDFNNLGAIVRSAAFFGIHHIILPMHESQSMITTSSYRVAQGGMEYVTIYSLRSIIRFLQEIKGKITRVGTDVRSKMPVKDLSKVCNDKAILLILGNEEQGISSLVKENCDYLTVIPSAFMLQNPNEENWDIFPVESLNVAQAASVILYEMSKES